MSPGPSSATPCSFLAAPLPVDVPCKEGHHGHGRLIVGRYLLIVGRYHFRVALNGVSCVARLGGLW
jgi:hypothetical protein